MRCACTRAAAVDQLETWAERADVPIVKPLEGGDERPGAVLDRSLDAAIERGVDCLIVDTSGRLSNNVVRRCGCSVVARFHGLLVARRQQYTTTHWCPQRVTSSQKLTLPQVISACVCLSNIR